MNTASPAQDGQFRVASCNLKLRWRPKRRRLPLASQHDHAARLGP